MNYWASDESLGKLGGVPSKYKRLLYLAFGIAARDDVQTYDIGCLKMGNSDRKYLLRLVNRMFGKEENGVEELAEENRIENNRAWNVARDVMQRGREPERNVLAFLNKHYMDKSAYYIGGENGANDNVKGNELEVSLEVIANNTGYGKNFVSDVMDYFQYERGIVERTDTEMGPIYTGTEFGERVMSSVGAMLRLQECRGREGDIHFNEKQADNLDSITKIVPLKPMFVKASEIVEKTVRW